ncbi:uncharacterized protein LOC131076201 isoform X2 [Cryptomeria japonica]|uniref:uncharacterized protein LOC131076201 isoform X2 n=1 Tax=Cryptomeria japonica TaxID=3369 RepID=UPI0025AC8FBC|nr:uncharacterized protein LOC131076201 isoform X2 [Cryptomeria japonica]
MSLTGIYWQKQVTPFLLLSSEQNSTDANIFQGAVFQDDTQEDNQQNEESRSSEESEVTAASSQKGTLYQGGRLGSNPERSILQRKEQEGAFTPAAHRGFLGRAKGIPAVELYRLAQKRDLKLVLCGHSMGGAVAVLATLAILRAFPSASLVKDGYDIPIKCITFSQPPVGNAKLRDYVHGNHWQFHFRTYCIPEDIVPRILSPAYFQHYFGQLSENNSQYGSFNSSSENVGNQSNVDRERLQKSKQTEDESLVLGLGPVQNSLQRLSRLVPLSGVQKQLDWLRRSKKETKTSEQGNLGSSSKESSSPVVQSLEIQEGADGLSVRQLPNVDESSFRKNELAGAKETKGRENLKWHRIPSFPTYVPFGQLHLLAKSSVEPLSASEYASLTSVQSVLTELKERFQAHSMKSYRSRFHRICELCVSDKSFQTFRVEHLPQQDNLHQWLGFPYAGTVEIGIIAETHIIRTAISIVPLGWNGVLGEKNGSEPLRVDVHGYGLHMCTHVQAQVDGQWRSTTVKAFPPAPPLSSYGTRPMLQKMCIQIGAPLKQVPMQQQRASSLHSSATLAEGFANHVANPIKSTLTTGYGFSDEAAKSKLKDLNEVVIYCSSDFVTTSKKAHLRIRRVRLLGLEGAGKTSLYRALLGQVREMTNFNHEDILPETNYQEDIAGGISFIDSVGVNLQDLPGEVSRLKKELSFGRGELDKKIDLVVLVHNLAHKIPHLHHRVNATRPRPALLLLMDEVTAAGIPWVLAITNKYAVSADQRMSGASAVIEIYGLPSNMSAILNSCAYAVYGTGTESCALRMIQGAAQRLIQAPMNLVQMPFRKKEIILPVEGVNTLRKIIHKVLISQEDYAFEELAKERLLIEEEKEKREAVVVANSYRISDTAIAGTMGAGLGIVVAIIMGAASAFRRP